METAPPIASEISKNRRRTMLHFDEFTLDFEVLNNDADSRFIEFIIAGSRQR